MSDKDCYTTPFIIPLISSNVLKVDSDLINLIHGVAIEAGDVSEIPLKDAIRDEGCIPAICAGDYYTEPVYRAAYYLQRIAVRHPYVEGNKRTAFLTAAYIIHKETGKFLKENVRENNEYVRKVANDEYSVDDVYKWLNDIIIR